MSRSKTVLLYLMAAFYIFGGYNHLANPEFYLAIMPPNLPEPELLNVVSGLAEILLGVFLLEPRTRALAAWGTIALLVAVFPANVYAATANVGADGPGTGAGIANWIRLPFQIVFIAWAWWYTGAQAADE
ncbi:MAG TPA: DoxX family membrane protein [Myxococcales bacterium]|jgi:uncharacterized membrane protein|nr:DoxX family membrane protein [Myxococcales bacterium]